MKLIATKMKELMAEIGVFHYQQTRDMYAGNSDFKYITADESGFYEKRAGRDCRVCFLMRLFSQKRDRSGQNDD